LKKQTWTFNETGTIPGIPGEWHAGQEVDIDEDTMTVVDVRLRKVLAQPDATGTNTTTSNTEPLQEKASAIAKTSTLSVSSPLAQESQAKK